MPTTVQFRRGTTAQNNAFTGAVGEISVDTDKKTLVVHDGSTAGGSTLFSTGFAEPTLSSSTANLPNFTIQNTADDATGPILTLESDRATPADNDVAGTIQFKASDDAGAQTTIATIQALITDVTNSTEDGSITFNTYKAGSDTTITTIDASGLTVNSGDLAVTSGAGSTIGNMTIANGSITDSSGTISFGDENLTTTGTLTAATGSSIGNLTLANGSITDSSGTISFGDENLTTTGTITGGIGVFDNIRIDNTAGEIDTSSGNLTIDSAGGTVTIDDNVTVTGNFQLDGNLTVSGTTTSVNTTNIEIQDALLELSKNNSGGSDVDSGILITRGSAGNNAAFYWNEGDDKFKAVLTTSAGSATAITDSSTATIVANLEGTSANMSGTVTYGSLSDGTITITAFADEDNMASNSATLVPTQQSVKAYVDSAISSGTSAVATEATNVTVTANDTANETVYITFVDGATGTQGIETDTNLTYNPSTNVLSTTASSAQYADLAENYSSDAEYEPGTVMSFGGLNEITQSSKSHDARVAGVVSTAPAYLMNADLENGTALALQGRTPCKVIGRIQKGDMIVASAIAGVGQAMDSSFYTPGCVIGKALESYDSQSVGVIEVVVGRL